MPKRNSEYARRKDDRYVTPTWVWEALWDVEPRFRDAFDCAPTIRNGYDFLTDWGTYQAIATNPPYGREAEKFVRHALDMPDRPAVAMLLPSDWDCAKGRVDLFADHRFRGKYILVDRIRWSNLKQKKNGPSGNHAWFCWGRRAQRKLVLGFLWKPEEE